MIFVAVQERFNALGINAEQAKKSNHFNSKIALGFITLSSDVFFRYMYIIIDAQTFKEYIESICMASITAGGFITLTTIVFKMDKLFALIESCEELLLKTENNASKTNFFLFYNHVRFSTDTYLPKKCIKIFGVSKLIPLHNFALNFTPL